jgi:hypothetical protein
MGFAGSIANIYFSRLKAKQVGLHAGMVEYPKCFEIK